MSIMTLIIQIIMNDLMKLFIINNLEIIKEANALQNEINIIFKK